MTSPPTALTTEEEVAALRPRLQQCIATRQLSLPLLPMVAHQVLLLAGDPKADPAKLSTLIQQDQALAGQVLRIANSPAYAPRAPIVSLQQAVSWLGLNMLTSLAFTVSIQSGVFTVRGHQQAIQGLWRSALATGLYGKEIARRLRQNVENAFLCGILHLIGKPGTLHVLSQIPGESTAHYAWTVLDTLLEEFHIQVGTKLGEAWDLPQPVLETIQWYPDHLYHQATSPTKGTIITSLAHHLAAFALQQSALDEKGIQNLPVVRALNFYPEDMAALFEFQDAIREQTECFLV